MTDLCLAITRKISALKNAFKLSYSVKQRRIYISSPTENEMNHLNDNLRDILGFTENIIEVKSAGRISGI